MEFQWSYFKSWRIMLCKRCTQYARKSGKLNSGHRTGKGQFSFQSQRKAMPKNVQTTSQLRSSHTSKVMLKILQSRLNNTWTENFQMYKLDLENTEEPEIKLPTSSGSWKKQESSRKAPTSASPTMLKPLCGSHNLWRILKEMGIPDHITCLLRNLCSELEATVGTRMEHRQIQNWVSSMSRLCIVTLLI